MLGLRSIAAKLFGTTNDRKVVKYRAPVEEMNQLEAEFAALSDADLKAKTAEFRAELAAGKTLGRPPRSGLRRGPRSLQAHPWHAPF